jgi:hypothetical protein
MQVAALTVGEPDPGLFQIPTDYVERSPSEVFQEAARLRGGECADCASRHRIRIRLTPAGSADGLNCGRLPRR